MNNRDYQYRFVAGNLALDFVNTVAFRGDQGKKMDHLQRAEDVHRWASQAHLPDWAAIDFRRLLGTGAMRRIRAVREQLFAVFGAISADDPMPSDTVAQVGDALHDLSAKRRLSIAGAEVRWTWRPGARGTDYLLYPVLTAAVDLLTAGSCGMVRHCKDAGCGWLFLDRSNARSRRWCSMADCGNRNKAREYYRREAGFT